MSTSSSPSPSSSPHPSPHIVPVDPRRRTADDATDVDEPQSSKSATSWPSSTHTGASHSPPLSPHAAPFSPRTAREEGSVTEEEDSNEDDDGEEEGEGNTNGSDDDDCSAVSASLSAGPSAAATTSAVASTTAAAPAATATSSPAGASPGLKRIPARPAQIIDQPMGTVVPTALQVSDLHWFTSDGDLMEAAQSANVAITFRDITFLEHKCNGKSKGTAFINCHSPDRLMRLKKWFEVHEFQGKHVSANVSTNVNGKPPVPPPTHDKDTGYRQPSDHDALRAPLPFLPTNSHGGVNFNRVPLHHRQQVQQMQQAGFLNPGQRGGRGAAAAAAATGGGAGGHGLPTTATTGAIAMALPMGLAPVPQAIDFGGRKVVLHDPMTGWRHAEHDIRSLTAMAMARGAVRY